MADVTFSGEDVRSAIQRAAAALKANSEYLTELDQAMGDGDLGITAKKVAGALEDYASTEPGDDLGKYIMTSGMKVNSAAPSTMGTLIASALMRAGKEVKGKSEVAASDLGPMLKAASQGIQDRGKAKPGDKTLIDALEPAAAALTESIESGDSVEEAGQKTVTAAQEGLDSVTPLQSRIGRAGWVGERTQGKVDPGCALVVVVLKGLTDQAG